MFKVEIFREVNGFSVYVEINGKSELSYFQHHETGVIIRTNYLVKGQILDIYREDPEIAARKYAAEKVLELRKTGNKTSLEDCTDLGPTEFIFAQTSP